MAAQQEVNTQRVKGFSEDEKRQVLWYINLGLNFNKLEEETKRI
jgi:hypothetical protein